MAKPRKTARERAVRDGLPIPGKRKLSKRSDFPADITKLTDEQVSKYMGFYAMQLARAQYLVAQYSTDVMHYEEVAETIKRQYRAGSKEKTKWRAEAELHDDERFSAFTERIQSAKASLNLTKALRDGYQHYYDALSRELTRRLSEHTRAGRGAIT